MVDYELFKNILSKHEDEGYIECGDTIDYKTMVLFAHSEIIPTRKLFKKSDNLCHSPKSLDNKYFAELKCTNCGHIMVATVTKTRLFEYLYKIRKNKKILCPDCVHMEAVLTAAKEAEEKEKRKKIIEENTLLYIYNYLDPNKEFNKNLKTRQKIQCLHKPFVDYEAVCEYINEMDYKDFICTPYWKAIAENVRKRANYKCQICNNSGVLNVHHRTYEHHGYELNNQRDLICLCADCHSKFHDKLKEL